MQGGELEALADGKTDTAQAGGMAGTEMEHSIVRQKSGDMQGRFPADGRPGTPPIPPSGGGTGDGSQSDFQKPSSAAETAAGFSGSSAPSPAGSATKGAVHGSRARGAGDGGRHWS